jgi:exonuclease 3'-5' domain-containing protein 1
MASYRLCATPSSLRAAAQVLSEHSHIILDCEGRNLGDAGGILSLLNLGVVHEDDEGDEHLSIFLVDVLSFQGEKAHYLTPIFDMLKSDDVFKIVFDGRMDFSELFHGHGVELRNVLDLQLVDILSREKRGEGLSQQLQRLTVFLPRQEIARNRPLYLGIQKLNNMAWAMQEHGIKNAKKRDVDHSKWIRRPLDRTSLLYAAEDICKIQELYDVFVEKDYINEDTLVQQSASYMGLHAKARPQGGKYERHGLLPLAILSQTSSTTVHHQCQGCRRDLPVSCFSSSAVLGTQFCFVCKAVDAHERFWGRRRR